MEAKQIQTTDSLEGKKLKIAGGDYRIVISGEQTNGKFAVIEMSVPPGAGPNPHAHAEIQESFFVLEGEVEFQSENGKYIAAKDAFVSIPTGGAIHGFKNRSNAPAKLLCTVIPAGLDDFFIEMAELMQNPPSESEMKQKVELLSAKYGQKLLPPNYLDNSSVL